MSDDSDWVSRREHELAMRRANLTISTMRDQLLQLGAQVVTLTDALEEKGVLDTAEATADLGDTVQHVRRADQATNNLRLAFGESLVDKFDVDSPPIPCDELMHLCEARCCKLEFALTTQDLDEGKVRWNYARPYFILQRADGYCVHNTPGSYGCTVYESRPSPCRKFDCRGDKRIWADYDKRIPAAAAEIDDPSGSDKHDRAEIEAEVKQHQVALAIEELALSSSREDA